MKKLATIDFNDYDRSLKNKQLRKASRAIIIKDNLVLMVHSDITGEYKFPGGGIKIFEKEKEALIRETKEETGTSIIEASIKEIGYIEEIRKSNTKDNTIFKQISYYYEAQINPGFDKVNQEDYESFMRYKPCFVDPMYALQQNKKLENDKDLSYLKRENFLLGMICERLGIK